MNANSKKKSSSPLRIGKPKKTEVSKDNRRNQIGARIRDTRIENGLTQKEFAVYFGLQREGIGALERGLAMPTVNMLSVLKNKFGKSYDFILDGESRPTLPETSIEQELRQLKNQNKTIIATLRKLDADQ